MRDRNLFITYQEVTGGNLSGVRIRPAIGLGTVPATFKINVQDVHVTLTNVIDAPWIPSNLVR